MNNIVVFGKNSIVHKNWRLIIGDLSDNTLELLPLKNIIQNNVITPVLAKFHTGGLGVKNKIIYKTMYFVLISYINCN